MCGAFLYNRLFGNLVNEAVISPGDVGVAVFLGSAGYTVEYKAVVVEYSLENFAEIGGGCFSGEFNSVCLRKLKCLVDCVNAVVCGCAKLVKRLLYLVVCLVILCDKFSGSARILARVKVSEEGNLLGNAVDIEPGIDAIPSRPSQPK